MKPIRAPEFEYSLKKNVILVKVVQHPSKTGQNLQNTIIRASWRFVRSKRQIFRLTGVSPIQVHMSPIQVYLISLFFSNFALFSPGFFSRTFQWSSEWFFLPMTSNSSPFLWKKISKHNSFLII